MSTLPVISLLSSLPSADRDALRAAMVSSDFSPGDHLIRAGATDHALYVLLSGDVQVVVGGTPIATLSAGALVGEFGFFEPFPERSADVVARTAVHAAVLERSSYAALQVSSPAAAAGLERVVLGLLSARLAETNAQLSSLLSEPPAGLVGRLRRMLGWGR